MSLAIDEAAVRIRGIQKGLSISEVVEFNEAGNVVSKPLPVLIKRAYPYFPKAGVAIADLPCFINQWTSPEISYRSAVVLGNFTMHMQLLVNKVEAEADRSAAIASAFFPKIVEAFAANVKLGAWAPATVLALRGGDPTLTVLDFAGLGFVGLDLFLDLHLNSAMEMTA